MLFSVFQADKMCADGVLIATHHAYTSGSMTFLFQRVDGNHALPCWLRPSSLRPARSSVKSALPTNHPMQPTQRRRFLRYILQPIAQNVIVGAGRKLLSRPHGGFLAVLSSREQMGICDGVQLNHGLFLRGRFLGEMPHQPHHSKPPDVKINDTHRRSTSRILRLPRRDRHQQVFDRASLRRGQVLEKTCRDLPRACNS